MRILFVTNYGKLYGANRSMLTLAEHFNRLDGWDVSVLVPAKGAISEELERKGISCCVTPYYSQLFYYKKQPKYLSLPLLQLFTLLMFPLALWRVRKLRPDIIYSNSSAENLGVWLAKLLGVRHVVHVREFMDLDFHARFFGGRKMKKRFFGMSDAQVFVSQSVASWVNMSPSLGKNQRVIYNGVNTSCSSLPSHLSDGKIHLGIVGIFDEAKGQLMAVEYMADVLKNHPNAMLHIYGDKECPYKKKVERLVGRLHLEHAVIMHGFVNDARQIYQNMDALLMCSRAEGFGRVTIEAMQFGVPVLGFNSGGTSELVKEGQNGYLFSSKETFLDKIDMMFSSAEHYQALSRQAFDYGHSFTTERYCSAVEDFLKRLKS